LPLLELSELALAELVGAGLVGAGPVEAELAKLVEEAAWFGSGVSGGGPPYLAAKSWQAPANVVSAPVAATQIAADEDSHRPGKRSRGFRRACM